MKMVMMVIILRTWRYYENIDSVTSWNFFSDKTW